MAAPEIRVGQRWRQTDGYVCDVVGFQRNGWPWVRHPNGGPGTGHAVNPAWFDHWALIRDIGGACEAGE